ncbi:MAG: MCP four helix bundle domain-containing protein [Deferribacterales bacterium]
MSVRVRLAVSFFIFLVLIVGVSFYSFLQIKKNYFFVENIYKEKMKSVENMFTFYRNVTNAYDNILIVLQTIDNKNEQENNIERVRKGYVFVEEAIRSFDIIKNKIESENLKDLDTSLKKVM